MQTFHWVMDINADGSIRMWELWETLRWAFRIPGSVVVEAIGYFPVLASLLDIQASPQTGYASLSGLLAKGLSFLFWVPLLVSILNLSSRRAAQPKKAVVDQAPLLLPMPEHYPVQR